MLPILDRAIVCSYPVILQRDEIKEGFFDVLQLLFIFSVNETLSILLMFMYVTHYESVCFYCLMSSQSQRLSEGDQTLWNLQDQQWKFVRRYILSHFFMHICMHTYAKKASKHKQNKTHVAQLPPSNTPKKRENNREDFIQNINK